MDGTARVLLALMGPTASGKSAVALGLARALHGALISADALQLYQGLDVGTAKPNTSARNAVPHYMLDLIRPHESYSAARYASAAAQVIERLHAEQRLPIICGGSGLYLRALLDGLHQLPEANHTVRVALQAQLKNEGLPALYQRLKEIDPHAAARIHPHDPIRISRALEVYLSSGKPLSTWLAQPNTHHNANHSTAHAGHSNENHVSHQRGHRPARYRVLRLAIGWPRPALYRRIDARVHTMLEQGWLDEVAGLLAQGYTSQTHALKLAIGYRELASCLEAGQPLDENTIAQIQRRTRQFAKRQCTWFNRDPTLRWITPHTHQDQTTDRFADRFADDIIADIMDQVTHFLAATPS